MLNKTRPERKQIYFISFLLVLGLTLQGVVAVQGQNEPEFRVEFHFGTVGIDGTVVDGNTGARIDKARVSFVALPGGVSTLDDIERIRVTAPGYQPAYVRSFTRVSASFLFLDFTVIDIGRVELQPTEPVNQGPESRFDYNPDNPRPGDTVSFDGARSYDPDGYVTSYRWDFDGDGRIDSSGRVTSYQYRTAGTYEVTLRVTDNEGATASVTQTIRVSSSNQPPVARFNYSPSRPRVGEQVQFDASDSYDPDGTIMTYRWDFDSDGKAEAWGENVTRSFGFSGTREIELTVKDTYGAMSSTVKSLEVVPDSPRFYSEKPASFNSNAYRDGNYYWIREGNDYAEWRWNGPNRSPQEAFLNFSVLISNSVNGGSGFEDSVNIRLLDDRGNVIETGQVRLNNHFQPQYKGNTNGVGYDAFGAYRVQNPGGLVGGFKVKLNWPTRNGNPAAVERNSITLAWTR